MIIRLIWGLWLPQIHRNAEKQYTYIALPFVVVVFDWMLS